jgi:hypothetical protein
MKTLSLRQPWLWAILHAGKRIENRVMVVRGERRPPTWHRYRGPILLHAAKGCTRKEFHQACTWMERRGGVETMHPMILEDLPRGGIVGLARIVDVVPPCAGSGGRCQCKAALSFGLSWHMPDQYGFVLTDVEPLPFTPCTGMLGLWDFDEKLLSKGAA